MLSLFADPLARKVAAVLRDRPDEWSADNYRLTHKSGVAVWIANGGSGLHVERDRQRFYGVTLWCLLGGSPSQHLIWNAVKQLARRQIERALPA